MFIEIESSSECVKEAMDDDGDVMFIYRPERGMVFQKFEVESFALWLFGFYFWVFGLCLEISRESEGRKIVAILYDSLSALCITVDTLRPSYLSQLNFAIEYMCNRCGGTWPL